MTRTTSRRFAGMVLRAGTRRTRNPPAALYPSRPMSELAERTQLAVRIVREIGAHAITYYQQQDIGLDFKPDRSPVTRADKEGEELARRILDTECPADAILGEEYGEKLGTSGYRWYLDPIDGTQSFVRGVPLFGCMAAVEHDGEPVAGAICFPALGEIVYAATGQGAWWANGIGAPPAPLDLRPARVSSVARLGEATFCSTGFHDFTGIDKAEGLARLLGAVRRARGWSDCYGHYLVATGRADVMIDPLMSVWDNAPLLPIIEEAGGRFTGLTGEHTIHAPNALSTNGLIHDAVLAALG